jgi:hypothetical protein
MFTSVQVITKPSSLFKWWGSYSTKAAKACVDEVIVKPFCLFKWWGFYGTHAGAYALEMAAWTTCAQIFNHHHLLWSSHGKCACAQM